MSLATRRRILELYSVYTMTTRMMEWEWIRQGSGRVRNRKLAVTLLMAGAWMVILACPSLASTTPTDDLIIYTDIVLYNATTNNTNNSTHPARRPNRRPRSSNYAAPYPTLSSSSGRASNNDTSNNFSSTSANSMRPTITSSPTTLLPTTLRPTTAQPTTRQPTITPSLSPTTASPSVSPTHRPTSTPTAIPTTAAPTSQSFVSYLRMTLTSMQKMDASTVSMWQNATSNFVMDYWRKDPTSGNITVQGLRVSTRLLNQTVTVSRRRRAAAALTTTTTRFLQQQSDQNTVVYQQIITYTNIITEDIQGQPDALAEQLATIPFEVLTGRNQYVSQYLQGTGNSAFKSLYLVSQVSTTPPPNEPTASPTTNNTTESFFQKYWIWFAIGGGSLAILFIIITITLCWMKKQGTSSNTGKEFHREEYLSGGGTNYIHTSNYSS